jgi:hypothetical protein
LVCCLIHDDDSLVAAIPLEYSKLPVTTWTSTNLHWGWSSALIDPTADERWMRTYAQWLGDGAGPWASVQMGLLPIDGPANCGPSRVPGTSASGCETLLPWT